MFHGIGLMGSLLVIVSVWAGLSASHLFGVWVSLEINLLSFLIVLVSFRTAPSLVFTYFLVQRVGSSGFLIGYFISRGIGAQISLILIMSLVLKLGAAPLQIWFIRVLGQRSWSVVIWLISIQKVLPFYLFSLWNLWGAPIILLGGLVGVIGSIGQTSLKFLLGYSSVFGVRWLWLGRAYLELWALFLVVYTFRALCFSRLWWGDERGGVWGGEVKEIPLILKVVPIVGGLRMAGFPPLPGFFMKVWLLSAGSLEVGRILRGSLLMLAIFFLFLYVQFLLMFFNSEILSLSPNNPNRRDMWAFWVLIGVFLCLILIYRLGVTHKKFWFSRTSELS